MIKNKIILLLINLIPFTRFFALKVYLLRLGGVTIGDNSKIAGKLHFSNPKTIIIGDGVWIGNNLKIYNGSDSLVVISDNVDIGPECIFITGSHSVGNSNRRAGYGYTGDIEIGAGSWIGADTTIIANSKVGKGVIVGAKSLVKGKLEDNNLYVGVPVVLKKRLEA